MYRKFVIGFLCVTLSLLIAVASLVYVVDPFNVYRADDDMTKIIYQMPYYQNVGIAKYTRYDTLITGSSMTQNFRAWWFNEKLGTNAIRLSFDGGIADDFGVLLDAALKNNKSLKNIYFGLDNYLITADSSLNKENDRIPQYLIDNNKLNDVKYLLNKDVLFNYMISYFSYKKLDTYDFYEMHCWDTLDPVFSKEAVLKNYTVPEKKSPIAIDSFSAEADKLSGLLCKFVEENPNVNFTFFAPPYSVLYWQDLLYNGKLDATLSAMKHMYSALLRYNNVRIFYFQNEYSKITDLDNYKDHTHYCTDYNKFMLDCFVSGTDMITEDSYIKVLDEMKAFVENYDFDLLLNS